MIENIGSGQDRVNNYWKILYNLLIQANTIERVVFSSEFILFHEKIVAI